MGLKRALFVPLALLQAGALAGQQETVRSAVVRAELTGDGAQVRVEYTLAGGEAGRRIPATVLTFAAARPVDLRVGSDGRPAVFSPGSGQAQKADLPTELNGSGDLRVLAEYTVPLSLAEDAGAVRLYIPILSPDRPPGEARPGLFAGEVRLPPGWRVSEAFPTGLRDAGTDSVGARILAVELPVVPATLSFRAHADGGWHPGLALVLDVLAALIVLGFSFLGWRHIRQGES